jgi:hypothetical protein
MYKLLSFKTAQTLVDALNKLEVIHQIVSIQKEGNYWQLILKIDEFIKPSIANAQTTLEITKPTKTLKNKKDKLI